MDRIGITTTVPLEVLLAGGYQPVDLNNIFINSPDPERLVRIAEREGFPLNTCTWIKGIYGVLREMGPKKVLCVTTGDCSNTIMLMEVLKLRQFDVTAFAYPGEPDKVEMERRLEKMACEFGADLQAAGEVRERLAPVRKLALEVDRLTWQDNVVSGRENHFWLVSTSDFNQDLEKYQSEITEFISLCHSREPYPQDMLRLGFIGVPPLFPQEFYSYLESLGGRVVFNEIQRQFAMPEPGSSLAEQYTNYTYPYSIYDRLSDIKGEIKRRRLDGIIHYVQAFCHRGIGDIIFRSSLDLPLLTIEGGSDFYLSEHLKTRLEAFLDMVRWSKRALLFK